MRAEQTEKIVGGEEIGVVHANDDTWRDLLHCSADLKDFIFRFVDDLLFDFQVVEVEDESPVEIALTRQRAAR